MVSQIKSAIMKNLWDVYENGTIYILYFRIDSITASQSEH